MLSDEGLKRQYDLYGEEGANRAQQRGGQANSPFGADVCVHRIHWRRRDCCHVHLYSSCESSFIVRRIASLIVHCWDYASLDIDANAGHARPLQNFEAFTAEEIFHMFFNGVHPNDIRSHRTRHGNRQYSHQPVCMETELCTLELYFHCM